MPLPAAATSPAAAAASSSHLTASPSIPTPDPRSPLPDLSSHGIFEADRHHLELPSVEDAQVQAPSKSGPLQPGERTSPPLPTPATLLQPTDDKMCAALDAKTLSSGHDGSSGRNAAPHLSTTRTAARPEEEEEEVELLDWDDDNDDDDDIEAASDSSGEETLAGLEAGHAASPAPSLGATAHLAESAPASSVLANSAPLESPTDHQKTMCKRLIALSTERPHGEVEEG